MFKLNPHRTYPYPVSVTVYDEQGHEQSGQFTAVFKVVPTSEFRANPQALVLDLVLVAVRDLHVDGPDGQPLEGEALLQAVKNDPATSTAILEAYQESVAKKNLRRSS